ncbi:MAG: nitroreductase family protein [Mogibacterium sp.]|nr:nitroreductase family protein [Mogibacterium sp.]
MFDLSEVIMGRKSVRTYDGRDLTPEDKNRIKEFAGTISNPFDIDVEFRFLQADEHGLSSPVLSGEKIYVAGITGKTPYADVAFGYSFEKLVLYAWSLGIGTVWIGGTMNRKLFEKAAGLTEGKRMPCISPLGYPAAKRAVRESLMRKGVRADSRKPFEELFFDGDFTKPLEADDETRRMLELVRWAPSAVNKQPWRIVRRDGKYHFYKKGDKGYVSEEVGDMQRIDLGIALCHFVMAVEESGRKASVVIEDPAIETQPGIEYIASVAIIG